MRRAFGAAVQRFALPTLRSSAPKLGVAQYAFAPVAAMQSMRFAATLSQVARDELAEETSTEKEVPQVPAGWKLERKQGEATFTMTKTHGDEKITVYSQLQVLDPEIAERRDEASAVHFPFTVLITRNGKTLDFSLTHVDGELVVDGLAHYESPAVAADQSAEGQMRRERMYQGPTFAELSHSFVDGVVNYLEERQINDDLSTFVAQYSYWLEQMEYENWLKAIAEFTK